MSIVEDNFSGGLRESHTNYSVENLGLVEVDNLVVGCLDSEIHTHS